jgi:hypothetical protein
LLVGDVDFVDAEFADGECDGDGLGPVSGSEAVVCGGEDLGYRVGGDAPPGGDLLVVVAVRGEEERFSLAAGEGARCGRFVHRYSPRIGIVTMRLVERMWRRWPHRSFWRRSR